MTSLEDRKRHIALKLDRAKYHLSELEKELNEFLKQKPFKVAVKIDEQSRKPIYYVESVEPVPDNISVIAGDCFQNLMTALDHLAYQLVCSDTNDNPPKPNGIYFPVAKDQQSYEDNKLRKMQGASQATLSAIDSIKPYKGGNDIISILHALNNVEKHRLLLTVGSQADGVELFHMMSDSMAKVFPKEAMAAFQSMGTFIRPADKGFPLAPGFELYIGAADEKPKPDLRFRFDVALNETGILEEAHLHEAIKKFVTEVENVINQLTPLLK